MLEEAKMVTHTVNRLESVQLFLSDPECLENAQPLYFIEFIINTCLLQNTMYNSSVWDYIRSLGRTSSVQVQNSTCNNFISPKQLCVHSQLKSKYS